MKREFAIVSAILAISLGLAYRASLPVSESDESKEWFTVDPKAITSITYKSPTKSISLSPQGDNKGFWIEATETIDEVIHVRYSCLVRCRPVSLSLFASNCSLLPLIRSRPARSRHDVGDSRIGSHSIEVWIHVDEQQEQRVALVDRLAAEGDRRFVLANPRGGDRQHHRLHVLVCPSGEELVVKRSRLVQPPHVGVGDGKPSERPDVPA